jgi:adenine-specific DNA-methyltransferase
MPSKPPEVKDYRHDEKRKNAPESGLISYSKEKKASKHYGYDPHLDPQLVWAGKSEHTASRQSPLG